VDRVLISDLAARCIIGVNERERKVKQDVLINIALYCDIGPAARSDRLADAVDYREVRDRVIEAVQVSQHYLLEALAETVAAACLEHSGVAKVTVRVDKPGALSAARSVAVEIERERA
jgi:FolB domain-containing protein